MGMPGPESHYQVCLEAGSKGVGFTSRQGHDDLGETVRGPDVAGQGGHDDGQRLMPNALARRGRCQ
jgi:hypothetical protein